MKSIIKVILFFVTLTWAEVKWPQETEPVVY